MATITTFAGCTPCCGVPCTAGCSHCPTACTQWTVTVAGIGQAGTSLCSAGQCITLNGTFTLKYRSGCNWTTDELSCGNPSWQIQYDTLHSLWRLNGASAFAWTIAAASFNCVGPNVMSFNAGLTSSADCNNLPATITVSPAAGCGDACILHTTCGCATPGTLYASFANVSNCPCMGGVTGTLTYYAGDVNLAPGWYGTFAVPCTNTYIHIQFFCTGFGSLWGINIICDTNSAAPTTNSFWSPTCLGGAPDGGGGTGGATCSPFSFSHTYQSSTCGHGVPSDHCCGAVWPTVANYTVTITA